MQNRLATPNPLPSEREMEHSRLATELAAGGMVLLENKGVLPLSPAVRTVALYGRGARRTEIGGTGSGAVNVRGFVSVEAGLEHAGFRIVTKPWLDALDQQLDTAEHDYHERIRSVAREKGPLLALLTKMGSPFVPPVLPPLTEETLTPADVCIYVLSRQCGEGADRQDVPGDFRLTEGEKQEIALISRVYERSVLLLNVGGALEVADICHLPGAMLLMGQGGIGCGDAVVALLTGKETPCGHLAATWPKRYADWPGSEAFGQREDAVYSEGSLVGYRWFHARNEVPLYPFGYGLSYTTFDIKPQQLFLEGEQIRLSVLVRNTGAYAGRDVVQVYFGTPHSLAAFGKTRLLQPGQEERLTLSFSLRYQTRYDEQQAAFVLRAGQYSIDVGHHVMDLVCCGVAEVPEDVCSEQGLHRLHAWAQETAPAIRCATPDIPENVPHVVIDRETLPCICHEAQAEAIHPLTETLTVPELVKLCIGAARTPMGDFSVIGNASTELPGAAGETTHALLDHGIPVITMADGPAGLRVNPVIYERDGLYISNPAEDPIFSLILPPETAQADLSGTVRKYQYCTALPVATLLAQTWDVEALKRAGQLIGQEMEEIGVSLWLAPGMNIQRNPLCGRNYEYYSEDPLLTGLCAAALTRGVQSHSHCGVCIKHLCCNNQETNRNYCNSLVSEAALREIYLRGFEICVREARPVSAMTAVNLVNGVHAANSTELLTGVLRQEWGFDGAVMTDWGVTADVGDQSSQKYRRTSSTGCIHAGNDLIMPGAQRDEDRLLHAFGEGRLTRRELCVCASHILRMMQRLGLMQP